MFNYNFTSVSLKWCVNKYVFEVYLIWNKSILIRFCNSFFTRVIKALIVPKRFTLKYTFDQYVFVLFWCVDFIFIFFIFFEITVKVKIFYINPEPDGIVDDATRHLQ